MTTPTTTSQFSGSMKESLVVPFGIYSVLPSLGTLSITRHCDLRNDLNMM